MLFSKKEAGDFNYQKFLRDKKSYYRFFKISKSNGKKRDIAAPKEELKRVQGLVLSNYLYNYYKPHDAAMGFIAGKSIVDNASKHIGEYAIYKIDIKNFFHSINYERVEKIFINRGNNKEKAKVLTEICTLDRHLPQGAPTSPAISNLICYFLDTRLHKLAEACSLNYSRYADDMVFSGDFISKSLRQKIKSIVESCGFDIATKKERYITQKHNFRQTVTGIVVNKKLSIGRTRHNMLRAMIHNCKTNGILKVQQESAQKHGKGFFIKKDISDLNVDFFDYLMGIVSFLLQIDNSNKIEKILCSMLSLNWDDYYKQRERILSIRNIESIMAIKRKSLIRKKIIA